MSDAFDLLLAGGEGLELVAGPATLRDSIGGELIADRRIAARWTIRRGEVFQGSC